MGKRIFKTTYCVSGGTLNATISVPSAAWILSVGWQECRAECKGAFAIIQKLLQKRTLTDIA